MRKINSPSRANGVSKFRRWAKATYCNPLSFSSSSSSPVHVPGLPILVFPLRSAANVCPQKARKSLHLLRSFCPYLEHKYVKPVKGEAHTGIRQSIEPLHCSSEFLISYSYIICIALLAIAALLMLLPL